MSQNSRKFNYTKWGFILGTPIAFLGAIATAITVPEVRCIIDKNAAVCSEQRQTIELITQTEVGESLAGVKIQFIAKGAPEVQYTDNNGYGKVRIPSKGDVRVNLSKSGYPAQDFTINLENDQTTTRIIRFNQSGQPKIEASSSPLPTIPSLPSSSPAVSPKYTPITNEFQCEKVYGNSAENYDNLITIGKRTEEPTSRFGITASYPRSITCKIIKNPGEIKLAYGLPDNSRLTRVSVKIYLDGQLRKTLNFGRGEAIRESIDITGASGYTIDFAVISPKDYSGDYIYMLPKS